MLFINFFTESLVPLQISGGFMFRRRIGTPNFNIRTCGGMFGKSSEFKNSVGYLITSTRFITILMDWYAVVSQGISFKMVIYFVDCVLTTEPLKIRYCNFKVDLGKLCQLTHWPTVVAIILQKFIGIVLIHRSYCYFLSCLKENY